MATQAKKLAQSLEALKILCEGGRTAVQSKDLTRTHRERLLAAGFLQEVMKGWYICTHPAQGGGESTAWYVSYWGFCADYLQVRLGDDWCLSPEQSLLLHAGNHTIPPQLVVRSNKGSNSIVSLPCETTLLPVRASVPQAPDRDRVDGLQIYSIVAALIAVTPDFFKSHETEARATLAQVTNASQLLPPLLEKGQTTIAGRLAGALANIGKRLVAEEIVKAMRAVGHEVRVSDPFLSESPAAQPPTPSPPYVNRLRVMWEAMRKDVIAHFPNEQKHPIDIPVYLRAVEETYVTDAYHSLSIEGYQVSRELIERVRSGEWSSEDDENDQNERNALAAKGYWLAFQRVKESLERVLGGENSGSVAEQDHGDWYRELFAPSVTAGIIKAADLAGYRNGPVYIRQSRHVPPNNRTVPELMSAFFQLLSEEECSAVRIVLGHFFFVNIHPYPDGNGRIGRFLMNLMLAGGGLPWLVVPMKKRAEYMEALETASVEGDIRPFVRFLGGLTERSA